jgi:hypothetical protein
MARRGFSEKNYRGANPLPEVTDAQVLKRAGLDMTEPKDMSPFVLDWIFAPGPDREFVRLNPGDHVVLRQSECPMFREEFKDIGGAVYAVDATDLEVAEEEAKAIDRAMKHYARQGNVRLVDIRKKHGLTREEMEDFKYDHWAYYYNQARADILKEALKEQRELIAKLKENQGDTDGESETGVE